MRRKITIVVLLALIALLSIACDRTETIDNAASGAETAETKPTQDAESIQQTLLNALVANPTVVFEEDIAELKRNGSENIAADTEREMTDDGVRFFAERGENPFLVFTKSQDNDADNQAFYVICRPSTKDFGLLLSSNAGIGFTVDESGEPCYFLQFGKEMRPISTDMTIAPDQWYHILLAVDRTGAFQGAICQDGAPEQAAYFRVDADGTGEEDRAYESWQLSLGFHGEATLEIQRYGLYAFEQFVNPES